MQAVKLSESAVAVLRFRNRGHKMPATPQRRPAYRELVEAGIMEPDGEEYRFTPEGWERREQIEWEETERIERERYEPPDPDLVLSDAAMGLLRRIVAGERVEIDEANRPAFRELAEARIVMLGHTFAKGRDSMYRFTYWGYERRFELAGISRVKETA